MVSEWPKKEEGNADGLWIQWYENGNKKGEGKYKKQIPIGRHMLWHENGKNKSEINFINGVPHVEPR